MAVTPEVRTLLDALAALEEVPIEEQTPQQVRDGYAALALTAAKEDVGSVTDQVVPTPDGDVPVRVYVPAGPDRGGRPGLVFLHGGGWVIGSLDTHDHTCRSLANGTGATVVSVDYRLAPEHRHPAAVDDALAALHWVAANADELGIDPDRLAIAGDSAGGNLAAVAAQRARDGGPALRFQLLIYPAVDMAMSHPSIEENAEGYFLTKASMLWFRGHYVGNDPASWDDPAVSPLNAPAEALAGLPPALVITAEFDPLRDEGEAYAAALRAAGVDATATRYDGVIHGFFSMPDLLPEGKAAIDEACQALRAAFD